MDRTARTESLLLAGCLLPDGSPSTSEQHWYGRRSGSGPARAQFDNSVVGPAPVPVRSVWGSRSVRLEAVLSSSCPHGTGSDPDSSSMGLVGSCSVRLELAASGSGSGPVWLGSSASGPAPAQIRRVWNSRSVRLGDVLSGSGPHGTGSDPGSSSMGLVGSSIVRLGLAASGSGSGPVWLGSSASGPASTQIRCVWS